MQIQLPFYPSGTRHINESLGFCEIDGTVYYLHNTKPIYCHEKEDRNGYRFILANLVMNKLCTIAELCSALGEGRKNIERYTKAYRENGAAHFFNRKERRGSCYKMTPSKLVSIQSELDKGLSIYRIALNQAISEAAISYHIRKGTLKKTLLR